MVVGGVAEVAFLLNLDLEIGLVEGRERDVLLLEYADGDDQSFLLGLDDALFREYQHQVELRVVVVVHVAL